VDGVVSKVLGSKKAVFTVQQEEELVDCLKDMGPRLFGLNMTECRKPAFQLAENNGLEYMDFLIDTNNCQLENLKRHQRQCAMGFNRVAVMQFCKLFVNY
jgi:hypothetical protein